MCMVMASSQDQFNFDSLHEFLMIVQNDDKQTWPTL